MHNKSSKIVYIDITNGEGIIDLKSDGFSETLIIKKPLTANWHDNRGSIGEYYTVSKNFEDSKNIVDSINNILEKGNIDESFNILKPFLKLFSNGKYRLEFYNIPREKAIFHFEVERGIMNDKNATSFYPEFYCDEYFYTRPYYSINRKRINYYKRLIKKGTLPLVIIYNNYFIDGNELIESKNYILDGHHKLEAYRSLGMDIPTIFISKNYKNEELNILAEMFHVLNTEQFNHYFTNSPIENVDFENNDENDKLFISFLKNSDYIGTSITSLLLKFFKVKKIELLYKYLSHLLSNPNLTKGIKLYYLSTYYNYKCWKFIECYSIEDFNKWQKLLFDKIIYNS